MGFLCFYGYALHIPWTMSLSCNKGKKTSAAIAAAGDCVTIPRATCTANGIAGKAVTKQCGRGGLQTIAGGTGVTPGKTICSK